MRISITGTPGTGKSSVSAELKERGFNVVDLTAYIKENNLREEYDRERDTYDVDVEVLNDSLMGVKDSIFDGHLSHFLDVDLIIVLRCSPSVLEHRLQERGYSATKVRENVESELLDVILFESVESEIPVFVIDTTVIDVSKTADAVEDIIGGNTDGHMPEDISWAEEMDRWF